MRLAILKEGSDLLTRLQFRLMELLLGQVPGPIRVSAYRKGFFGTPFLRCLDEALRGDSVWTAHERELFASFISHLNQCPY